MFSNINNYFALNDEHKWEDLVSLVCLFVHWSGDSMDLVARLILWLATRKRWGVKEVDMVEEVASWLAHLDFGDLEGGGGTIGLGLCNKRKAQLWQSLKW